MPLPKAIFVILRILRYILAWTVIGMATFLGFLGIRGGGFLYYIPLILIFILFQTGWLARFLGHGRSSSSTREP